MLAITKAHLTRQLTAPPAIIALVIQCCAVCLVTLIFFAVWQFIHFKISFVYTLLADIVIVVILTRWLNLAWWWYVIQPLFPIAVVLMLMAALPPMLYFIPFLLLLILYWSTFRTQVPYYPSNRRVWEIVEQHLPKEQAFSFVDIGSGLGGLTLFLGKRYPESQFLGVEIAPLPWLVSYLRNFGRNSHVQFIRSNYNKLDFTHFDVVFAYLSPAVMSELWLKAKSEMRPGSLLISYEFPIDQVEPKLAICLDGLNENGVKVYFWTF